MAESVSTRPWAAALLVATLLAGTAIAGYLVVHHENHVYGDATLTLANCPETETVNCDLVNSSAWSEIAGVPIAALAIPTYLLLVGLLVASRRVPAALAWTFCIGLATVVYSIVLLVVSKTQVGFLCLWCMRLYAVNLATPILAALAARRSPVALAASTWHDLRTWPAPLRRAAIAFVGLLALTVAGDRTLRTHVRAVAAEERRRIEREGGPTVPAVPETPTEGGSSSLSAWLVPEANAAEPAPATTTQPYKLAGPLRRLEFGPDGAKSSPFDLQARLGRGKPVALIFWAPGWAWSERALVTMAAFLRNETPDYEVYAVSGRRDDQVDGEIQEAFALLDVPAGVPLLVDDGFAVSTALTTLDVPNLALFSAKGQLVIAKIKSLDQLLITANGNRPAEEIVRLVAKGAEAPQIPRMHPYYPSSELLGRCAPAFDAKVFGTNAPFGYSGRAASGKPTLVMFWSSTCKHCQVDIPQLVTWVKAHPNAIDVIGVTTIRKDKAGQPSHRAITEAYIRAQGIPWTIVEDPDNAATNPYRSVSTPTSFFISPSGTVTDIWYYAHDGGFDAAMNAAVAKARAATPACREAEPVPVPRLAMSVAGRDGKRVELASILDRPTLVHFWATWCKPCVEELPSLMKFRETLEKDGRVRVVLISVEGEADAKRIEAFQKTLGVDLRSYRAPKGGVAAEADMAYRLPRTFLVKAGGEVLEEKQGRQDWADPAVTAAVRARLSAGAGLTR
jgi:cytochrome c biogenesis protein CcmG, thiol:disulfide interchange protein DsbE